MDKEERALVLTDRPRTTFQRGQKKWGAATRDEPDGRRNALGLEFH